jgi:ribosomal-protein-alanine N-acetyltransferase
MAASDADFLLAIARASPMAPDWRLPDYQQIPLSDPSGVLYRFATVADSSGMLSGFVVASLLRAEELATLEGIVVHPGFQRQGIGAALLVSAMGSAYEAGARAMRLEVRASNAAALCLYRSQGFQSKGGRRAYYSAPVEDALLLEAPLPGVSR